MARMMSRRLVQVKIGTLPGDVMWLLRKRTWPKVGEKITLRHVGQGSHGAWDIVVEVKKVTDERIYCSRWAQGQTRSYGNEKISIADFMLWGFSEQVAQPQTEGETEIK